MSLVPWRVFVVFTEVVLQLGPRLVFEEESVTLKDGLG